jgi:ketosteroid isomerase-like protein
VEAAVETDKVALARQLFGCFGRGDMDAVFAAMHPDVETQPSIDGSPVLRGRRAVAEWWRQFASSGGDVEARALDFEARGDHVIVRGYLRQRHGRAMFESLVFWLCEIRDGQLVRAKSLPSREAALAAAASAGARPAPR